MSKRTPHLRIITAAAALAGLVLGPAVLRAQSGQDRTAPSRFSISAGGGMGMTEDHQGLLDLRAGIEYRLTSSLGIDLGFQYLKNERHFDMGRSDGRWGRSRGSFDEGGGPDFRIPGVTLNLVYSVPVGRKWDLGIGGGAGYYFGTFSSAAQDVSRNAWGGRGALRAEYRLSPRISAFAEAGYRFLKFRDVPVERPVFILNQADPGLMTLAELFERGLQALLPEVMPRNADLRLSGSSFGIGLRFRL